jgi:hypothetical protein
LGTAGSQVLASSWWGLSASSSTLIHLAVVDEGAALQVPREGDQVGVTGATADRGCLCRGNPPAA